jgi:hypothetical protein
MEVLGKMKETRLHWVSELIKPDTRSWDEATVRKYFYPHDAEDILAIKLTQAF